MFSTPFRYHFDNICEVKVLFWFWYIGNNTSTFKKWRIMSLPILMEKYCVLQVLWCEKSQSSWRSFNVFPYQNLICYLSIWLKEEHHQVITYYKLIELFLVDFFFINVRKKLPLSNLLYFPFCRCNMWHLSKKQLIKLLFWFWHRKNDTRLYSYTSSNFFHIKSPIIY